jgi:hypothetical protein
MKTICKVLFKILSVLLVWLSAVSATFAQAPQPAATDTQNDSNQQLATRVQELEKQVAALKAQSAAAPVADAPTENEVAPRLKLNVFGDVGFQKYTNVPNTFMFGSLDLFMRARLSDKVSALGEVLFIAENDNSISADVERLLLTYHQSDYFSVSAGRYHTWVGYYNTAFNYGEFLETTTDRPFVYAFDDRGGVLPMQEVGVNVTGKIPSGKLGLNYVVEAGNGKDWNPGDEPSQNNQDRNDSKSINGGLFVRPEKFDGLQVGFSVRYDNLSIPGPAVSETIATAHVVFVNSHYEILNEGVLVRHVLDAGQVFHTSAFYTQWSRRFGSVRPYFRYQYFNADQDDPVYVFAGPNDFQDSVSTTFVSRLNGPSAGIRYDFTEHSALKLQYDHIALRGLDDVNGITSQIAFTF